MEYVDGQLVGVRDRMASAKATEGESRSKVLQDVRIASFCSYLNWFANAPLVLDVQGKKTRLLHSQPPLASGTCSSRSCITSGTRSWLDTGHIAGWVNRTMECEMLPSVARIGGLKRTCSICRSCLEYPLICFVPLQLQDCLI